MAILLFFVLHWYLSLFVQTFFLHRYAAHRMFTMSPFWERAFHVFTWLAQGSSYLNPAVYGMMHRKPLDKADVTLCIDATGIGAAVVDLAKAKGTNPVSIQIHGGMEAIWTDDRMSAKAPKADLIGCLTVLAQTKSVTVARGLPHADTLRQELKAYQARINPNTAHVSYGNDARQAPHDDLVLSVAIPLWTAENRYPRPNPICRLISVGGRHNW